MKKVEMAVEKLLKFMQQELEYHGCKPKQYCFNFSSKFTQYFFNSEPEEVLEGEELTKFRNQSKLTDEIINKAIKICLSREYVTNTNYCPGIKNEHMGENTIFLLLSDI